MTTPFGSWLWFDLSPKGALASTKDIEAGVPMPVAGTIKEVWVGGKTTLTTGGGTLGVYKYVGTVSANVLSAATIDLQSGITAGVPAKATLTTAPTTLRVAAGNMLVASWILTTVVTANDHTCLVAVEPDVW